MNFLNSGDDIVKRKVIIGIFIFILCGTLVYSAVLNKDMRDKLENIRRASEVYDRNGKLIGNLYYYQRIWTPLSQISKDLQNAVVAIEDSRFYQHNGIDIRGIARAALNDLIPGHQVEGGSTITQQLAKISLLSSKRTITRKIKDITYALEIEKLYTKQEILELYLNSIYLAHGNVGVETASRYYFGKSASQLSLSEAALLAAVIRSPEYYSPMKRPKDAKERRNLVLKKMFEQKMISKSQYDLTVRSGVKVIRRDESGAAGAYFLDYVRNYLIKNEGFSEEELRFGGYKIYSTLDLEIQRNAEQAIATIPDFSAKVQPQAAMVTLDPRTGEILAMVGGRNYGKSQLNRAISAYRQPGSAIKPFVYATALEKGYTAASIFEDKPLEISLADGTIWKPENYDRSYRGKMTLREALRNSINTVTVQLLQGVGVEAVAEEAERMGVTSLVKKGKNNDLNLAPLALGGLTKGVTPLELAAAYTPFANQGNYAKPYPITKVIDRQGNRIKEFAPENRAALSAQTAFIMTSLMEDVVNQGTGLRAKLPDRQVAGKTGTSSDYTNAWFVGYTPDLLTAVWIGNDRQDRPMQYVEGNIGSASAAEIWGTYMKAVTAKRPVSEFIQPPGVIWADVNPDTGEAVAGPTWFGDRQTYKEVFNERNVPESGAYKIWHWFFPSKKWRDKPDQTSNEVPEATGPIPGETGNQPVPTTVSPPTPSPF